MAYYHVFSQHYVSFPLLRMDTGKMNHVIPAENLMWQNAYLDFILYLSLINIKANFPISKYREELWSGMRLYYSSCIDAYDMGNGGGRNEEMWNDGIFDDYIENNMIGPCGKIHLSVSSDINLPLSQKWTIEVYNELIINTTIITLGLMYSGILCDFNFLLVEGLPNEYLHNLKDNNQLLTYGKYCGIGKNKILYSATNHVVIKLKVSHFTDMEKDVLHLIYQGVHKASIQWHKYNKTLNNFQSNGAIPLSIKSTGMKFHGVDIFSYHLHSLIKNIIIVHIDKGNCLDLIAFVQAFDGPSSRSPVIKEYNELLEVATLFKSTLSILTVFISGPDTTCINMEYNVSLRQTPITTIHHSKPHSFSKEINLKESSFNQIAIFNISVPSSYFVNVRIDKFVFEGITEYGCLLGGVAFIDKGYGQHGPFCGQFGSISLSEEKLGGITFSSSNIVMIVFMYSENHKLSFKVNILPDNCEGVINYCNVIHTHKYSYTNFKSIVASDGVRSVIKTEDRNPDACIRIQGVPTGWMTSRMCKVNVQQHLHFLNATIQLMTKTIESKSCDKVSIRYLTDVSWIFLVDPVVIHESKFKSLELVNSSYNSSTFLSSSYNFYLNLEQCSFELDASYVITLLHQKKDCKNNIPTISILRYNTDLFSEKCAHVHLALTHGYRQVLLNPSLSQVFTVSYMVSDYCKNNKTSSYLVLTLQRSVYNVRYVWKLGRGRIIWKVSPSEHTWGLTFIVNIFTEGSETPAYVSTFRGFVDKIKIVNESDKLCQAHPHEIFLNPNQGYFLMYDRKLMKQVKYIPINTIQSYQQVTIRNVTFKSFTTNPDTFKSVPSESAKSKTDVIKQYCIKTACYLVLYMAESSWNTASHHCKKHNSQLLSINSQVEENILASIMNQNDQLLNFTLVYLNMKQDLQVDIYYLLSIQDS